MDKTVFMSTIPHHSSSAHNHQERLETMCFDIPVNSSRRSSSEAASYMDDSLAEVFADKSLPDIPLSPSSVIMDIKASR